MNVELQLENPRGLSLHQLAPGQVFYRSKHLRLTNASGIYLKLPSEYQMRIPSTETSARPLNRIIPLSGANNECILCLNMKSGYIISFPSSEVVVPLATKLVVKGDLL